MGFKKWVFKETKEKIWLEKEEFEVAEIGFKRGWDTFILANSIAYYKTNSILEILPMRKTMEQILKDYSKVKRKKVNDLLKLNKILKRRF